MSAPSSDPGAPPPPRARPLRPPTSWQIFGFVGTIVVFALLGPPIGGLVVIAALANEMMEGMTSEGTGPFLLVMLIAGWWMSYPIGIVPALAAGVAIGLKRLWGGGAGLVYTLATGLVVGLVWAVGFMDVRAEGIEADRLTFTLVIAASIVATLACWLITGGVGRAARIATTGERLP